MKSNAHSEKKKIIGVIPARYGSTRFPGKLLVPIVGKTLIQLTYENIVSCPFLDSLYVATDDERIFDHVQDFGGKAVLTGRHETGTERIAEAVSKHDRFQEATYIVNIQGDEPCVEHEIIGKLIESLDSDPDAVMSTPITPITSESDAINPSVVKCVIDSSNHALYFSRALIPAGHDLRFRPSVTYYKHIGLYCYRPKFLMLFPKIPSSPLQRAESLEQLKVLENGYRIKTVVVKSENIGIDVPEDLNKLEERIWKQNLSSSQGESALP